MRILQLIVFFFFFFNHEKSVTNLLKWLFWFGESFYFYFEDSKSHTQKSNVDQQSTVAVIIGVF